MVPVSETALVSTWQGKNPNSGKQQKRSRPSDRRFSRDNYLHSKCPGANGGWEPPQRGQQVGRMPEAVVPPGPRVRVPRGPQGAAEGPQKRRGAGVPSPNLRPSHPHLCLLMLNTPPRGQRAKGSGNTVPGGVDLTRPGGHRT